MAFRGALPAPGIPLADEPVVTPLLTAVSKAGDGSEYTIALTSNDADGQIRHKGSVQGATGGNWVADEAWARGRETWSDNTPAVEVARFAEFLLSDLVNTWQIAITTDGKAHVRQTDFGSSLAASSGVALPNNTPFDWWVHYLKGTGGGGGTIEFYVDGALVVSYTGVTTNLTINDIGVGGLTGKNSNANVTITLSRIRWNDSTGSTNNTAPAKTGFQDAVTLLPNAEGFYADATLVGAGTGWECVDDATGGGSNDGDTTYYHMTSSAALAQTSGFEDLASATSFYGFTLVSVTKTANAASTAGRLRLRENATDATSSALVAATSYQSIPFIRDTLPDGSLDLAGMNALEGGGAVINLGGVKWSYTEMYVIVSGVDVVKGTPPAGQPTMRRWSGVPGMQYTGRRSW